MVIGMGDDRGNAYAKDVMTRSESGAAPGRRETSKRSGLDR